MREKDGIVALHLPFKPLYTPSAWESVPRYEHIPYQPISLFIVLIGCVSKFRLFIALNVSIYQHLKVDTNIHN